MKKLLLAITIAFSALASKAQTDYPLVTSGTKYFSDGDEIYTLNTTFKRRNGLLDEYETEKQSSANFMCKPDTLSWLSDISVVNDVSQSEGYIGIFKIQAWRPKGYKWLAYENSTGKYKVWAEIESVTMENFLGTTDSVKTITFQVEAQGGIPEDYTNELYYKIAKHYGIIETKIDHLRQTKGVLERTYGRRGSTIRIVGVNNNNLQNGWKVLSESEIYNFAVGDEFHYQFNSVPSIMYPHSLKCSTSTSTIQKVLAKESGNDSVFYRMQRTISIQNTGCTQPGSSILMDTIRIGYPASNNALITNQVKGRLNYEGGSLFYQKFTDSDSIIHLVSSLCIPYGNNLKLAEGLGVIKQFSSDAFGGTRNEDLVYYKKGAKTWGNKLIMGVHEDPIDYVNLTSMSPNPATDNFTLTTIQKNVGLQLFDASGKERLTVITLSEGTNNINISSLEPGLYLYKILSGSNQVKTGKLIVH